MTPLVCTQVPAPSAASTIQSLKWAVTTRSIGTHPGKPNERMADSRVGSRKRGTFLNSICSAPGNRAIFSTFWGNLLLKCTESLEKEETNPLEKIQRNPVETAPRNCRFLSLVAVEHESCRLVNCVGGNTPESEQHPVFANQLVNRPSFGLVFWCGEGLRTHPKMPHPRKRRYLSNLTVPSICSARIPAISCENPRFSAVSCEDLQLPKPLTSRGSGRPTKKSAKIRKNCSISPVPNICVYQEPRKGVCRRGLCKNVCLSLLWHSECLIYCWAHYPWVVFVFLGVTLDSAETRFALTPLSWFLNLGCAVFSGVFWHTLRGEQRAPKNTTHSKKNRFSEESIF